MIDREGLRQESRARLARSPLTRTAQSSVEAFLISLPFRSSRKTFYSLLLLHLSEHLVGHLSATFVHRAKFQRHRQARFTAAAGEKTVAFAVVVLGWRVGVVRIVI